MSEHVFRLYDTQSRTVKPLELGEPGHLRFYSCGPTVYSYAHIGNFRTFLTSDLVIRTAQAIGWRVTYVSNITDVGHLTEDDVADASGEDKMEKALKSKDGAAFANVWDLARFYAEAFENDWVRLRLLPPTVRPRATEHMREQIQAVQELIEDGHAYESPTGVYFDVNSFERYGALSGNVDRESLRVAVRDVVQDENKRHPADFALWKKDDKHLMQWFSPWGWGFPGWHIECSVMARQYLGDTIDLHGGGEDLKFPHHECEIAQSESITGEPFCRHWMHVTFLQVDGQKMSKSKGNYYTVRDLVDERGRDAVALRLALIAVPYGKPLNFTLQSLADAEKNVERIRESRRQASAALERTDGAPGLGERLQSIYGEALGAMLDDLNTSVAIAKALEGVSEIFRAGETLGGESARAAIGFLDQVDALLGIAPPKEATAEGDGDVAALMEAKIAERAAAKASKDFARADAIRAEVEAMGYELRDTPNGTVWRKRGAGDS